MGCVYTALSVQAILYYTFGALGGDTLAQMTMVCVWCVCGWGCGGLCVWVGVLCGGVCVGGVYVHVCMSVPHVQGYRYLSGVNVEQSCESALAYYARVAQSGEQAVTEEVIEVPPFNVHCSQLVHSCKRTDSYHRGTGWQTASV